MLLGELACSGAAQGLGDRLPGQELPDVNVYSGQSSGPPSAPCSDLPSGASIIGCRRIRCTAHYFQLLPSGLRGYPLHMNAAPPELTSNTVSAHLLPASTGRSTCRFQPAVRNLILPRVRRLFTLWLACAAVTGVAADKEATDGLTAQQLLDKMADTYATCKSYRDSGVVTNDFGPRPGSGATYPRHVDVKPFRTAFVRPDRFLFEYHNPTPEMPYIIWAKEGDVRTWWYIKPGEEKQTSLEMAVAGATGVSSGSAHTIPALLLPQEIGGRRLTMLTDLKRLPDEAVEQTPCFKLEGKYVNRPTTLWLDKSSFLLFRMVQDTGFARPSTSRKWTSRFRLRTLSSMLPRRGEMKAGAGDAYVQPL